VHYIPLDHDDMNKFDRDDAVEKAKNAPSVVHNVANIIRGAFKGKSAKKESIGGHEQSNHDELEVRRHREDIDTEDALLEEQEKREKAKRNGRVAIDSPKNDVDGKSALHLAAADGNFRAVQSLLKSLDSGSVNGSGRPNYDMIHARDENDWQAIHEAARGGHLDVLKLLIEAGADLNAITKGGGTALDWARSELEEGHPVIEYLESLGAEEGEGDLIV
jgi:ankyrin repeat protein